MTAEIECTAIDIWQREGIRELFYSWIGIA